MPTNSPEPSAAVVTRHGLRCVALTLPGGDQALVALHGAQVISWRTADGTERLYLSPRSVLDGHTAIRGGIPVCFPQFADRGPLPKHGFVRNLPWTLQDMRPADAHTARAVLRLNDDAQSRAWWPYAFEANLAVTLAPGRLRVDFAVQNTGDEAWAFTAALHSYLHTADIAHTRLEGLAGTPFWDKVRNADDVQTRPVLAFDGETDRVYQARTPLQMVHPAGALAITQSDDWDSTVVWNPGAALGATLADMPPQGFAQMLCVEAGRVRSPFTLVPGAAWTGWQQLSATD
ncbi:D-hexose-6-phosphate mutarotase [Xylophilus sp. GW821-FHT01B05]